MDFRFGIEVGPGLQFRLVFLLELELDWGFGSDFLGTDMGLQGRDANAWGCNRLLGFLTK